MSVSQISVFVESKPGHLSRVLEGLDGCDINIRGFSASDTGGYGIVRFIVDKPDVALEFLSSRGFAVRRSEVLCIKLNDTPGELKRTLNIMADCGINVVYCYSLAATYIVLAVKDLEDAERQLKKCPVDLVDQDEITRFMTGSAL